MKTQKIFLVSILLIFLIPVINNAQDISVHKMIGKTQREVMRKYGKPVHRDKSNPAMDCMFYKTKTRRITFVANQDGVYQAEATASYNTERKARSVIDNFITHSLAENFAVDTVTVNDFTLHKHGVNATLQLCKNNITNKFEIRVKAHKTED